MITAAAAATIRESKEPSKRRPEAERHQGSSLKKEDNLSHVSNNSTCSLLIEENRV